jgi:putative transposase
VSGFRFHEPVRDRPHTALSAQPPTSKRVVKRLGNHKSTCAISLFGLPLEHNISAATFYAWKAKYGGLEVNEAQELKRLREENSKLKRVVADLTLDNVVLKDLLAKNW